MITIKNLRSSKPKYSWDFKVDRSSPVGNPYNMKDESERDKVCDKYDDWFYQAAHNQDFFNYLNTLSDEYKQYGRLNLFCWCAPKRCHAETIRNYLINKKECEVNTCMSNTCKYGTQSCITKHEIN